MNRLTICALICLATSGFAETPWYKERGTPVTMNVPGFVVQALLPRGWAITDGAIIPPAALGPDCRARVEFYGDREWDRFLVSEIASTNGERVVLKINGHPAVSNQYVSEGDRVMKFYIDLSELEPKTSAVWSARSKGGDCELQFLSLVHTVRISRDQREAFIESK